MFKYLSVLAVVILALSSCAPQHGPRDDFSTNNPTNSYSKKQRGSNLFGNYKNESGLDKVTRILDRQDIRYYNNTFQTAINETESGSTSRWISPETGNSGTVTPTRTYQNNAGAYCREFTQKIAIGSGNEEIYGAACRQQDGTWKIIQ